MGASMKTPLATIAIVNALLTGSAAAAPSLEQQFRYASDKCREYSQLTEIEERLGYGSPLAPREVRLSYRLHGQMVMLWCRAVLDLQHKISRR